MSLFGNIPADVKIAAGDLAKVVASSPVLNGFGIAGAVLEARGVFALGDDPSPTVNAGEIFSHSAGDRFTIITIVATPDGIIETETNVVDVGGELLPVTSDELASDTALSQDELGEKAVAEDSIGAAFVTGESGIALGDSDVAIGAIDFLPSGGSETVQGEVPDENGNPIFLHSNGATFETVG
jgi:hypothetical protein